MTTRRTLLKGSVAGAAVAAAHPIFANTAWAQAPTSLQIFVPAAPGGGWDSTARTMEMAMKTDGIAKDFKFEHAPGAGGAVGLPKFLSTKKGQADALLVGGMVMVGALIANKSPVSMKDLTPVARLTGECEVLVVPAASPLKTIKDWAEAFKADPGKMSVAGGSAGGTDHILDGHDRARTRQGPEGRQLRRLCRRRTRQPPPSLAIKCPAACRGLGRVRRAGQGRQDARARHLG